MAYWVRVRRLTAISATIAALLFISASCGGDGSDGDQTAVIKADFESWAVEEGLPYKDASFEVESDDGTFAVVHVTAWFRRSATSPWVEQEDEVKVRNVGEIWQRDSEFSFSLTAAAQNEQNTIASATAAVVDATAQADARARGTASQSTREAQATEWDEAQTATADGRIAETCRPTPLPNDYGLMGTTVVEDRVVETPDIIVGSGIADGPDGYHRFRFVGEIGQQLAISASTDKDFWRLELRSPSDTILWSVEKDSGTSQLREQGELKPLQCNGIYSLILVPKHVYTNRYSISIRVE